MGRRPPALPIVKRGACPGRTRAASGSKIHRLSRRAGRGGREDALEKFRALVGGILQEEELRGVPRSWHKRWGCRCTDLASGQEFQRPTIARDPKQEVQEGQASRN